MLSIRLTHPQRAMADPVLASIGIQDGPRVDLRGLSQLRAVRSHIAKLPARNLKQQLTQQAILNKLEKAEKTC